MSNNKQKSKCLRIHKFRLAYRSSAPTPMETRELGPRRRPVLIEPTQLSAEYELIKDALMEVLSARTSTFMALEGIMTTNEHSSRYLVVLLPTRYKAKTVFVNEMSTTLESLLSESVLVPKLLFGNVGFRCAGEDPKNPYFQQFVECGASIGPEGKNWSGSFGGYLKDKSTGEVFGLSCCHNFCANEPYMADATPEQLVELIPASTEILQPSPADRQYRLNQLKDAIDSFPDPLGIPRQHAGDDDPPSFIALRCQEMLKAHREEQSVLENGDHRFARLTPIYELGVDRGVLWDYMLLTITNTDRLGINVMHDRILRPLGTDLKHLTDTKIEIVGRTSGYSTGRFRGFLADAKVPRLSAPFRCPYATGWWSYGLSELGDSGSFVGCNSEAIGMIFGGGVANDNPIDITWISDLKAICERIKEKWGKDLVVYEGY